MKRLCDAPDQRQRGLQAAQGLHQPDEGQGIYQQRQRQAQFAAMGQKANAGADCGQRQHHKALVQVELYKGIVPLFATGGYQDQYI